jgi:hypothetical protein
MARSARWTDQTRGRYCRCGENSVSFFAGVPFESEKPEYIRQDRLGTNIGKVGNKGCFLQVGEEVVACENAEKGKSSGKVRKTHFLEPLIQKQKKADRFAKTGSGHT